MQLDVFVPELSLAFEYQGRQHFEDVFRFAPQKHYADRDLEKRIACKYANITLIEVPYWWDMELSSLQATIHKARPDIMEAGTGQPIQPTPLRG